MSLRAPPSLGVLEISFKIAMPTVLSHSDNKACSTASVNNCSNFTRSSPSGPRSRGSSDCLSMMGMASKQFRRSSNLVCCTKLPSWPLLATIPAPCRKPFQMCTLTKGRAQDFSTWYAFPERYFFFGASCACWAWCVIMSINASCALLPASTSQLGRVSAVFIMAC